MVYSVVNVPTPFNQAAQMRRDLCQDNFAKLLIPQCGINFRFV